MFKIILLPAFLTAAIWSGSPAFSAQNADETAEDTTREFCTEDVSSFAELSDDNKLPRRVICAEVAALDQMLVYNRFGSHNPYGQIFALTRDLVPVQSQSDPAGDTVPAKKRQMEPTPAVLPKDCSDDLGVYGRSPDLKPGQVRLNDCKRPRPLTLRANVGDVLHVRLRNYLRGGTEEGRPGYSETFCRNGDGSVRDVFGIRDLVSEGDAGIEDGVYRDAGLDAKNNAKLVEALCAANSAPKNPVLVDGDEATDWPRTRGISFVIDGLRPVNDPATGAIDDVCLGLGQLRPGEGYVDCYWHAEREGPYFINSIAAPAGGEGDGGSLTQGLFGSLTVEPQTEEQPSTQWYRSQTSKAAFDKAWPWADLADSPHNRAGKLDYEKMVTVGDEQLPVLNLLKPLGDRRYEIVSNALNAIVDPADKPAFREFTVVFHDELKTFYTRNFEELGRFPQLEGVKDGFAINYGASGLGAMVLANRKGIGPSAQCMECLYEEFFLESWANGDPALLERYADDPSNVHHSYLNDPVVYRNYHAGPKETHVFHLHAHQWFGGNDDGRGSYLDSQTVAPRQGFTYRIYHGGLNKYRPAGPEGEPPPEPELGWWETLGSGNRNRTVGDSIFHCHLYPHFAQGMWALWRVHDVLEDGSRKLPDGQAKPGLSTELLERDKNGVLAKIKPRRGSVDEFGRYIKNAEGTPIPALVPLPDQAAPLLPTYAGNDGDIDVASDQAVPGYPFFVAGEPGHRSPQAPYDIAAALPDKKTDGAAPVDTGVPGGSGGAGTEITADAGGTKWLDGGLQRHVVTSDAQRELGISVDLATDQTIDTTSDEAQRRRVEDDLYRVTAKMLALGDFSGHLTKAGIKPLENDGEPLEKAAMAFHYNGRTEDGKTLKLRDAYGNSSAFDPDRGGYKSAAPGDEPGTAGQKVFPVNGAPPKPGAPFADPCGAPDSFVGRYPMDPKEYKTGKEMTQIADPFGEDLKSFVPDPAVTGFRRYAASAVQVDIVTNKAGWHDPQGRINVLTSESDKYKNRGPSAREEPFFFRAYSGECIEFRHTNELPKELELDDFQVQTPTDTIGQHIHLVKFDVTSGDGSGNGFNYEDGTFAPDEIATRLCAWAKADPDDDRAKEILAELEAKIRQARKEAVKDGYVVEELPEGMSYCDWPPVAKHKIWNMKRGYFPFLFQTSVQRWFADPILSMTSETGKETADRTMRTVFSHDHFGPSSIQQHGFYSALVIEPPGKRVCPGEVTDETPCLEPNTTPTELVAGDARGVGTHKIVDQGDDPELHPNYREYALAIADFALLYDPTDADEDDLIAAAGLLPGEAMLGAKNSGAEASPKGLAKLVCEAEYRASALAVMADSEIEKLCNSRIERYSIRGSMTAVETEGVPPAMVARDLIDEDEVRELRRHFALVRYRAGYGEGLARPVSPPERPEAISVDHHDPYLVNYRGEPVPLRIGETGSSDDDDDAAEDGASDGDDEADHASRMMEDAANDYTIGVALPDDFTDAEPVADPPAEAVPAEDAPVKPSRASEVERGRVLWDDAAMTGRALKPILASFSPVMASSGAAVVVDKQDEDRGKAENEGAEEADEDDEVDIADEEDEAAAGVQKLSSSRSASGRTAFDCFRDPANILKQFKRRDPEEPKLWGDAKTQPDWQKPGIDHDFEDGLEDKLAAAAGKLDCSIDSQSADPRGDLAHVYRSEFFAGELMGAGSAGQGPVQGKGPPGNRPHGDPVTPLLETYTDERIQIRLIQGAQEVQHTFNIEGLQWRRQIDQKYPANSVRLTDDYQHETWWQSCYEEGRKGLARQHDRWRNGKLSPAEKAAFWDRRDKLVARCDNIESFVAAQEVGISEHFEIPAAPSKYAYQYRSDLEEDLADRTAALDYMFNFGSQDALWNGAWGLMRVYETSTVRDETRRIEAQSASGGNACAGVAAVPDGPECVIGTVLKRVSNTIPENRRSSEERSGTEPLIPVEQPAFCPKNGPIIEAFAVAMPVPGGQQYASKKDGFRDPNGLALVHVPKHIVAPWLATGVPDDEIPALRAAAREYYRDQPMVIRANAGDCLRLSVVNAIAASADDTASACGHAPNGNAGPVVDCLGDAPMPKLVKLNVEPSWSEPEGQNDTDPRVRVQQDDIDVRPSSRVAFTVPVPMLTRGENAHLPFGVNPTTSKPPGSIQTAEYYMGLLRMDWPEVAGLMGNTENTDLSPISNALLQCKAREFAYEGIEGSSEDDYEVAKKIVGNDSEHYAVLTSDDGGDRESNAGVFPIELFGQTYFGFIQERPDSNEPISEGVVENVAQMTVDCVTALLIGGEFPDATGDDEELTGQAGDNTTAIISAIPYAFGAVPIKPVADMFNHLSHGLFGALVVEPQGARYPGRLEGVDGPGEYSPAELPEPDDMHRGNGHNTEISFTDANDKERSYREFVLFYQDGLNLWDDGSTNRFIPRNPAGRTKFLPIVDDCGVCDDTYDWGEKAVSYLAPAFYRRLRQSQNRPAEAHSDLNGFEFEDDFRFPKAGLTSNPMVLDAKPGEEVVIRVIHPGGRARQRAFVTVGNDYDDMFPGFGFPHSALLAPGKALSAAFTAPVRPECYLWSDGPRNIEAAGAWGLLDVRADGEGSRCVPEQ
ncbi:hypothetical protein [Paracoccus sp. SCSIO 75233]|uniref:hypothetical protein n=1 Tax=Paracoccus sp. SCSIO 75233 TaxID=3017782 RepID=UPI0022F13332|nr:hypothetical protein [Paracoccus sp. SCSIO 75233]WBU51911.1 hypothetical protein PAF12_08630 [Paracoccus sp. SCSIO 75233]